MNHAPRYKYDCPNCKFSWCCGPTCWCILNRYGLSNTPPKRTREVKKEIRAWLKRKKRSVTEKELEDYI